jgi:hypothetical protein
VRAMVYRFKPIESPL